MGGVAGRRKKGKKRIWQYDMQQPMSTPLKMKRGARAVVRSVRLDATSWPGRLVEADRRQAARRTVHPIYPSSACARQAATIRRENQWSRGGSSIQAG